MRPGRFWINLFAEQLHATRSAENGVAASVGVAAGGGTALSMVSASGTVAGLSASGITSGLAALGGLVGGGMAVGLLVTVGGAALAGTGAFFVTKQLVRWGRKRLDPSLPRGSAEDKTLK
jgi:hypothetical protein